MTKLIRIDGPTPYQYDVEDLRRAEDGGTTVFQATVLPETAALKGKFRLEHEGAVFDVLTLTESGLAMKELRPGSVPVIVGKAVSGTLSRIIA
jgi:hypothetical protein